jgi:DNA polymerase III delta subunit
MDKIKILAEVRDCKKEEAYLIALEQGLIYNTPKTVVFDFIDAVLVRNIDLSFEYWKELKELKTAEVLILSLLYTGFRNVLLIQGSDKATSESTGLTGWQIQTTKEKTGYYSIPELIDILKSIQNSESGIKTGKVETEIAVELALIKIFEDT